MVRHFDRKIIHDEMERKCATNYPQVEMKLSLLIVISPNLLRERKRRNFMDFFADARSIYFD